MLRKDVIAKFDATEGLNRRKGHTWASDSQAIYISIDFNELTESYDMYISNVHSYISIPVNGVRAINITDNLTIRIATICGSITMYDLKKGE